MLAYISVTVQANQFVHVRFTIKQLQYRQHPISHRSKQKMGKKGIIYCPGSQSHKHMGTGIYPVCY